MAHRWVRSCFTAGVVLAAALSALADAAPFDLSGPKLEVKITRAGKTLPIAQVPNLATGDKVWIKADLPDQQAARYLLVAAFLRGSTNPPPENWFFRQETWNRKTEETGLTITVPQGAQQVVVFLAPETGGDFHTLVNAVRGRPGAFVRASQDLNQAMLDRSRLDAYLGAIRKLNAEDPDKLKEAAPLLARSLGMKVDDKCLDRIPELQAVCLMQGQDSMILNDGHSQSIVSTLTSGPAADLAGQLSYTPAAAYGFYSPYIGSVMDMARILEGFHTAQYQYIPAMGRQEGDALRLMLNTPPSFHNPKSVLVTALPAVEASQPPPLHPVDSKQDYCAEKNSLVLAVDGAPLVFSTGYVHELSLRLKTKAGKFIDEPVRPDPIAGGLVLEAKDLSASDFDNTISASLHGYWGFEKYDGPAFRLQNTHAQSWQLAATDRESLIVGRDDTIHLSADDASCVDTILVKDSTGKEIKTKWKATSPDELTVTVPLKEAHPGPLQLQVKQYGTVTAQTIPLRAFAEAGHLNSFTLHAGDANGVLKGSRLEDVASLTVKGVLFTPGPANSTLGDDELPMVAKDAKAAGNLKQGTTTDAEVTLTDGRTLKVDATVTDPRPGVELLGKSVQTSASSNGSNIQLANEDELPQDAKLRFSVRAKSPKSFTRAEHIEVATQDGVFSAKLSLDNGGMTLQDSQIALVTLDPAKAFGGSAFGPLKFRVIDNGIGGDWQPLATLVRLPTLQTLKCPSAPDQQCRLSGSNLFLVDSVSSDPQFSNPVQVPDGFPGYVLPVPHSSGALYLKLRDDPTVVNQVTLAAETLPPPPGEAAAQHAAPRPAYHESETAPAPGATIPAPAGNSSSATTPEPKGDQKPAPPPTQPSTAPATGQSQDKTPPPPAKPANPQAQSSQTTAPKSAPSPAPEAAKPTTATQQATSQQP